MNRGARRAAVFADDATRQMFLDHLAALPNRRGVVIHAYALMPNHFHLLIEAPQGNLSKAMQTLQGRFSQQLNLEQGWDGPVFKGRFRNRVACDEQYWAHLLAYLHLNPVRAGLAADVDHAKWTSHQAYVDPNACPSWLNTAELLGTHGGLKGYLDYLAGLGAKTQPVPAGFDAETLWTPDETGPQPAPPISGGPSLLDGFIRSAVQVATVTKMPIDGLLAPGQGRSGNPARWVLAWWLLQNEHMPTKEVARFLDTGPSGVSKMVRKARARRCTAPLLNTWMSRLERMAGS